MLKITYTEMGLHIEPLPKSIEEWLTVRTLLSLRAGQQLVIEPCTASLLLRADLPNGRRDLEAAAIAETTGAIALSIGDVDHIEVTLRGTWVSSHPNQGEGVFVTTLGDRTELLLVALWSQSQGHTSPLRH